VHPSQISEWKHHLLDEGPSLFGVTTPRQQQEQEALCFTYFRRFVV
jgi:hypothetical protein